METVVPTVRSGGVNTVQEQSLYFPPGILMEKRSM